MKTLLSITAAAALLVAAGNAYGVETVAVSLLGSNAGNAYAGGTSFNEWWSNAQYAVMNGLSTYGTGNGTFNVLSPTNGESGERPCYEALATGFDSWQGVAETGTGEHGHRVHWVYRVEATAGEALSLANIGGIEVYEDGWGDTDYAIYESFYGSAVSFDSSTTFDPEKRVGYAADGTLVMSGTVEDWDAANPTNTISDIVGHFGMAYAVYYDDGEYWYQDGDTKQDTLDRAVAEICAELDNWDATLTYDTTTVTSQVNFAPEPATLSLLALGGLALVRRRRG